MIIGNANPQTSSNLQAINKTSWVYATRFDASVSDKDIVNYLKEIYPDINFTCDKLPTKHPSYASFKIGAPWSFASDLMKSENWPEGILIGKYYPPRSSRAELQGRDGTEENHAAGGQGKNEPDALSTASSRLTDGENFLPETAMQDKQPT